MSNFYIPEFDSVDPDRPPLPSKGWHDMTLKTFEATQSQSSGRDMMNIAMVIDNGDHKGYEITERIVFGTSSQFGERRLAKICQSANFAWEVKDTLTEFVDQFPEGQLRVNAKLVYEYSIKKNGQWDNDVPEETYEAWEGEDKGVKAVAEDFRAPDQPAELDFTPVAADGASDGMGLDDTEPPF